MPSNPRQFFAFLLHVFNSMKIYVESGGFLWFLNQISELFWNDASKEKAIVVRVIGMYKLGQHVDISGEDTNEPMAHFFMGSKLIGYPVFRLALATINSNKVNREKAVTLEERLAAKARTAVRGIFIVLMFVFEELCEHNDQEQ